MWYALLTLILRPLVYGPRILVEWLLKASRSSARWLLRTRPVVWIIAKVIPRIRLSFHAATFTGEQYLKGLEELESGDIILTLDQAKLGAKLTPGQVSHAALCITANARTADVAEMTSSGFAIVQWFDICHHSDRVIIVRCLDWDREYLVKVIGKCLSFMHTEYDYQFEADDDELYCSELITACDVDGLLNVTPGTAVGTGQEFVSPQHILDAKNVVTIFDSDDHKETS
jgi:Permuted papain-like amidase enzyme, YaeF/YiiX, C92 family